jgi:anti-sigma B factor antagonist
VVQLSLEQSGDVRIVRVKEAKLTYPVLSSFFVEVRQMVEDGARKLVVDLEAVTYIDCATIGCLMDIHRLLEHRNGAVKLSGLRPRVETMLLMTGVQKIVDVRRDEAEALAAFGWPPKPCGDVLSPVAAAAARSAIGAGSRKPRDPEGGCVERAATLRQTRTAILGGCLACENVGWGIRARPAPAEGNGRQGPVSTRH